MWKFVKTILNPLRRISSLPASQNRGQTLRNLQYFQLSRNVKIYRRCFCSFLDIIKSSSQSVEPAGEITQRIKSASDTQELLEFLACTKKQDIEAHQLCFALNRLFSLQKSGFNTIPSRELTKHNGFNSLEHLIKFKVARMEVNDCVSCLKTLNYFGLKSDSITIQRVLNQIKDQINELSSNNIVFLNFVLSKMNQTPLVEAIQIALPIVFNLNLSQKIDHNNPHELTDLLFYATSTTMRVSSKSMTNIITALTLHGKRLELDDARSVIWSFTAMQNFEPEFERLFNNCMSILNSNFSSLSFDHMETTLAKVITKFQRGEFFIYNEEFFNNCARFAIEKDVGYLNASYILKKFNKMNFVSYELLNYVEKTVVDNHSNLSSCKPAGLLSFSAAFSNASYKSENWNILKSILHENPLMHSNKMDLPWIKFAVEMMAVDFHSNHLLEKIFSTQFLDEFLSRKENFLDHVQFLLLYQSVKTLVPDYSGPWPDQRFIDDAITMNSSRKNEVFMNVLTNVFGGREFIQSNVLTSLGHCLEFVLCFDNYGSPVALPCQVSTYDEIPRSQVTSVAIFFNSRVQYPLNYPQKLRGTFDLKKRTIEALGIKTCNISTIVWNNLPQSEKNSFLEREIRFAARILT